MAVSWAFGTFEVFVYCTFISLLLSHKKVMSTEPLVCGTGWDLKIHIQVSKLDTCAIFTRWQISSFKH